MVGDDGCCRTLTMQRRWVRRERGPAGVGLGLLMRPGNHYTVSAMRPGLYYMIVFESGDCCGGRV